MEKLWYEVHITETILHAKFGINPGTTLVHRHNFLRFLGQMKKKTISKNGIKIEKNKNSKNLKCFLSNHKDTKAYKTSYK